MIDFSTYEVGRVYDNLPKANIYYADAENMQAISGIAYLV